MSTGSERFRLNPISWVLFRVAGIVAAASVLFALFRNNPDARLYVSDMFVPAVSLAASACLLYAAWRLRIISKRLSGVWLLFGLGQLAFFAGDFLWTIYELVLQQAPFPSAADLFYLLFIPLFLAGIFRQAIYQRSLVEWTRISIDMVLVVLVSSMGFWNFLIRPLIEAGEKTSLELALSLAYPVGDLMLLWGVIFILYRLANEPGSSPMWLLAGGLATFVVTDSLYSYEILQGQYQSGNWLDLGYLLGYGLLGAAGFLQARQAGDADWIPQDTPILGASHKGWTIYLPYTWVVGAYLIIYLANRQDTYFSPIKVSIFLGGITMLVIARQLITIHENQRLSTDLHNALNHVRLQAAALERTNLEMQAEIHHRLRVEEQLTHEALHDALTGLPNRAMFLARLLESALQKRQHNDYRYAVLFLDLDSFKVINDSMGHQMGDHLLVKTAQILKGCVRPSDTVARLGGDEFVILLDDFKSNEDVLKVAGCLQTSLCSPIVVDGLRLYISVSIGIVMQVDEYERPEDVLRDADLAMYQAKSLGKARFEIFNPRMRAGAISRMTLESDLRRALECHEFALFYQPVLTLPEGRLVGFEALVRWRHPERGLIGPNEFIPIAEETGLILKLGEWVLYEACHQAHDWLARFPQIPLLRVSVNISGKQLQQSEFIKTVKDVLESSKLPSQNLVLEVTESICLDNLETTARTLYHLQALGVEIQIDDFGTGYSSLSYLQRLPVYSIKIDKSFIQTLGLDCGQGQDMLKGIFTLVDNLGIKAVAEGIETEYQLDALNRLQCAYGQGFYLARPMDRETVESWLQRYAKSLKIISM